MICCFYLFITIPLFFLFLQSPNLLRNPATVRILFKLIQEKINISNWLSQSSIRVINVLFCTLVTELFTSFSAYKFSIPTIQYSSSGKCVFSRSRILTNIIKIYSKFHCTMILRLSWQYSVNKNKYFFFNDLYLIVICS